MNWDEIEKHCGKEPKGSVVRSAWWAKRVQDYLMQKKIDEEKEKSIESWNEFKLIASNVSNEFLAPYDGKPFLACIWGNDENGGWVGIGIYTRHYDADGRCPGKYEFFYITKNPEEERWKIKVEENPFPITHWMPLPKPVKKKDVGPLLLEK